MPPVETEPVIRAERRTPYQYFIIIGSSIGSYLAFNEVKYRATATELQKTSHPGNTTAPKTVSLYD